MVDGAAPEGNPDSGSDYDAWSKVHAVSRRSVCGLGAAVVATSLAGHDVVQASTPNPRFTKLVEADLAKPYPHVHEGEGTVSLRYFGFDKSPAPAHFVIYDMPPGSSEGVHTHQLGDTVLGPYDEYYYIIDGQGEMEIDGETVLVKTGDHVHTPLTVPHGIRNTHKDQNLRVFLTFITRTA